MSLITEKGKEKISAAISEVERHTHAELVTVLARQADDYYYIPILFAVLTGLMTPPLLGLTPLWLEHNDMLWVQMIVLMGIFFTLRIPVVLRKIVPWIVPKNVRSWRAGNLARRQFLENNLHRTEGATGVLIFVSEAERYVEIIADSGINKHVQPEQWVNIVNEFTQAIKRGDTENGFLRCIEQCGALLKEFCPAHDVKNELPNRLVLI